MPNSHSQHSSPPPSHTHHPPGVRRRRPVGRRGQRGQARNDPPHHGANFRGLAIAVEGRVDIRDHGGVYVYCVSCFLIAMDLISIISTFFSFSFFSFLLTQLFEFSLFAINFSVVCMCFTRTRHYVLPQASYLEIYNESVQVCTTHIINHPVSTDRSLV